jgi:SAM-dependent methyltransferase
MDTIYERPRDYDLEHEGDDEDIRFHLNLIERLRPRRVLELACGSGRVTIPLGRFAAQNGGTVVGLELSSAMLEEAERKRRELRDAEQRSVKLVQGDLREWASDEPFDLIVTPCSSLSHLLTLEDQIAAWRRARANLVPGGRFVVDLTMPDLGAYADSMQTPPRSLLVVDSDSRDPDTGERLIRFKTTEYMPHEQRAAIRFVYDKFPDARRVDRYVSDFECHVYYPREVDLLFMLTGFEIESRSGDYYGRPLRRTSRQLIVTGRRSAS